MSALGFFLTGQNNPFVVLLSLLMSCGIWWGVLVIESTIRSLDYLNARKWRIWQSLLLGFGIWAFHFIGMLGWRPGFTLYFDTTLTFTSLLFSILAAYSLISAFKLTAPVFSKDITLRSLGFTLGLGAMHYLGIFSAQTVPGAQWDWRWIIVSLVLATILSLSAVAWSQWRSPVPATTKRNIRFFVALGLGVLLFFVHYTGAIGARFPDGSFCINNAAFSTSTLAAIVIICGLILAASMMFTSNLEARMESKLQEQNRNLTDKTELLEQLLFIDSTTELPNRNSLEQTLHALVKSNHTHAHLIKVLLVSYESICDSWGQEFGNKVIDLIKGRIMETSLPNTTLYRASENVFEILSTTEIPDIPTYISSLSDHITQSFEIDGKSISLGCQIGFATANSYGELTQLPSMARSACDYARRSSVSWLSFEPHMLKDTRDELEIQAKLRKAIHDSEFRIAFQPKIDAYTGELVSAEALIRWSTGDNQFISPAKFIPIAEKYGLINAIGQQILHQSLAQQAAWIKGGLHLRLAINLSPYQLEQHDLVKNISILLNKYQVPPSTICFEITESAAMLRPELTIEKLKKLRQLGVELSMDDFGTGYSSLSLLHILPLHELKIDRSFVQNIRTGTLPIIRSIIQMAKDLRMRTVAEGIESEDEKVCMTACGVDELQGYLISMPLFAEAFTSFAKNHKQVSNEGILQS
jgi:diguanylate cyclase